jgi:geranylgeranyl reductase family protein
MQLWDAIIVGAGPAGCAAAYDLAAAGRRVLLLDKAQFPRSKACAGALTMKAVRALRYSITPVVRHTVREIQLEHESVGVLTAGRRKPVCVMTVRAELDAYCLEKTCRRGVVFRQIGPISGLRQEPDRVVLELEGEQLAGRVLLGADGVHSRVRGLAGASASSPAAGAGWFRTGFAVEANVPYSATGRAFPLVFDFAPVAGGYGWLFPRNDHVNVGLYTAGSGPAPDRAALSAYIAARCGTTEHTRAVGQFLGFGGAGYAPAAGRVLLAGDAAGCVDPLTGEGIYGAIASGQAAAAAILSTLQQGADPSPHYRAGLARLRADLSVAERAARRFYAQPERGFRLMQMPLVRRAVLHSYSEGLSLRWLDRGIGVARRLMSSASH